LPCVSFWIHQQERSASFILSEARTARCPIQAVRAHHLLGQRGRRYRQ
jgi:hypothetical protein